MLESATDIVTYMNIFVYNSDVIRMWNTTRVKIG